MNGYVELLAKREVLDAEIEAAYTAERIAAIIRIRADMTEFGISASDLVRRVAKGPKKEKRPVGPKYRDPVTGNTWTGRGKPPRWMAEAANRDTYLILSVRDGGEI